MRVLCGCLVVWLAMVGSAQAQGLSAGVRERAYAATEYLALTGQAIDATATQRCRGAGTCHELNPWLARYDNPVSFTAAKFGVASLQLWAMRKLKAAGHPRWAAATNIATGIGFGWLGVRNYRLTNQRGQ